MPQPLPLPCPEKGSNGASTNIYKQVDGETSQGCPQTYLFCLLLHAVLEGVSRQNVEAFDHMCLGRQLLQHLRITRLTVGDPAEFRDFAESWQ